jgi:hypothetical protein
MLHVAPKQPEFTQILGGKDARKGCTRFEEPIRFSDGIFRWSALALRVPWTPSAVLLLFPR